MWVQNRRMYTNSPGLIPLLSACQSFPLPQTLVQHHRLLAVFTEDCLCFSGVIYCKLRKGIHLGLSSRVPRAPPCWLDCPVEITTLCVGAMLTEFLLFLSIDRICNPGSIVMEHRKVILWPTSTPCTKSSLLYTQTLVKNSHDSRSRAQSPRAEGLNTVQWHIEIWPVVGMRFIFGMGGLRVFRLNSYPALRKPQRSILYDLTVVGAVIYTFCTVGQQDAETTIPTIV